MTGRGSTVGTLTNVKARQAVFLTLTLFLILVSRFSLADALPATEAAFAKQRISQATTYIRQQGLRGLSLLPGEARQAIRWISGGWQSAPLADEKTEGQEAPSDSFNQPPSDDAAVGTSLDFHHKGFLPTHDALVLGVNLRQSLADDKLRLTARPFYGQSWHSLRRYWGMEAALTLAHRSDGLPWGKISMGYVGGDAALTDHGRGLDLHGDVDLTRGFKLTSGVRQSDAASGANYVMLRWELRFGDNP